MFNGVYSGKRVLITGHTGFKGSWLCQWLLDMGAEVAGYSVDIPTEPSHFDVIGLKDRIHHCQGDVRDFDQLYQAVNSFEPQIIFHLAAQPIVYRSYDDPQLTFHSNLQGTVNVLEAIRKSSGIEAAIIVTSDKCYENVEWDRGYKESDRLGGKDPYSASKACAEIAFSSYARSFFSASDSPKIASVRAGNVIGGGDWADNRIVPDCAKAWSENARPEIRSPDSTRPWQHVLEPLSGYLWLGARLLEGKGETLSGTAFNFGPVPDSNHTVEELLVEIARSWPDVGWDCDEKAKASAKKEANLLQLNCEKALAELGWEANMNFAETSEMTAKWYFDFYCNDRNPLELTTQNIRSYESLARERNRVWTR